MQYGAFAIMSSLGFGVWGFGVEVVVLRFWGLGLRVEGWEFSVKGFRISV